MIAACIHCIKIAIRRARAKRVAGIRHDIAAAQRARLTRNAHRSGDMMRKYMRDCQ